MQTCQVIPFFTSPKWRIRPSPAGGCNRGVFVIYCESLGPFSCCDAISARIRFSLFIKDSMLAKMKLENKRVRKISAKPARQVGAALIDYGTYKPDEDERAVLARDLKQRVKELNCLYGLARIIETPGISLEEILQVAVTRLPAGFQYPDIACARIVLGDTAYSTSNYSNTKWRLSTELRQYEERIGQVEVYYLKEKPNISEGPFLAEERTLIDSIGERLSRVVERKRAETTLKGKVEDLSRLATVVSDSNDAVIMHDFDGKILAWNRGAKETYGYTEVEMLGKNVRDIVAEPDREAAMTLIQNIEQGEVVKSFELRRLTKDGRTLDVWLTTTLLRDEKGKPVAIATTERDITERKRGEEALRGSENRLRTLFAGMTDVVIVYDADGRYLEIAPTLNMNLRQPASEMLGKMVSDLFPPDEARFFLDHIRQALETGHLVNAEYSLRFGEQDRWFSATASPLSSDSVLWVAHDITAQKQAEGKMQRQLTQLSALSEIDRTIASTLDLRLSLSTLLTHVIREPVVDAADVLVLNPTSLILEYAAGIGFRTDALQHTQLPLGQGFAGMAGLERRTIHVANLQSDNTDPAFARNFKTEDFEIYFGLPLLAKGKLLGVLEVFRRTPVEPDEEWLNFLNTLAEQAAIAIDNARLFDSMQRSNTDLTLAYDSTIAGWSHALDLRDHETEGHTQRVTEMALGLAGLFGLRDEELVDVRRGSLLHDIGKMGVPDSILHKPESLTNEEWVKMRKHPTFAFEMLSPIQYLHGALDIPYCHHEKWDGSGYPRGLKGEQIPLVARIFAVVDVWDALTSDRPYRPAWTKEKAHEQIQAEVGIHFDPHIVEVFLASDILQVS